MNVLSSKNPRDDDLSGRRFTTLEFDDHYVIQPQAPWWKTNDFKKSSGGRPVAPDFEYVSHKNSDFMSPKGLLDLLVKIPLDDGESKNPDFPNREALLGMRKPPPLEV